MNAKILLVTASYLAFVTGCASITTGQTQPVSVEIPNCPNASCRLSNRDGTYFLPTTPGTVEVNRACGQLALQCSSPGQQDFLMSVSSSIKAMAWGNIVFGGFIGAGVDAATGAACEYPALIPVPMSCGVNQSRSSINQAVIQIPQNVLDTADELSCEQPTFMSRAPAGVDIYTSVCDGENVILSCGTEECSISEYTTGTN